MGSKPKASEYKPSQAEVDQERIAKADAAYFAQTYDPLLLEMRDKAASERVAPTLRGRAQADTMQQLMGRPSLALVQGIDQSANIASGAASQMLSANVAAKDVKTQMQVGVLGVARGQAADAGDALAQASRLARSEGLAKASAKQQVRLARRQAVFDISKAGFGKMMQNKGETDEFLRAKGEPTYDKNKGWGYETSGLFGADKGAMYPGWDATKGTYLGGGKPSMNQLPPWMMYGWKGNSG